MHNLQKNHCGYSRARLTCAATGILPLIHVFCLSPIDFHPSSLQSISLALQFLFYMFLALAADHNVIGKHHGPWRFLSDLIRHPIHQHCKQQGSKPILDAVPPSPRTPPSLLPHTSPQLYCRHTYLVLFSRTCLPIQTFSCNTTPVTPPLLGTLS